MTDRPSRPHTPLAPEVRKGQEMTWIALVVITVGVAGGFLLDTEADPVAQGLLATLAALQVMIAVGWWRRRTRRS